MPNKTNSRKKQPPKAAKRPSTTDEITDDDDFDLADLGIEKIEKSSDTPTKKLKTDKPDHIRSMLRVAILKDNRLAIRCEYEKKAERTSPSKSPFCQFFIKTGIQETAKWIKEFNTDNLGYWHIEDEQQKHPGALEFAEVPVFILNVTYDWSSERGLTNVYKTAKKFVKLFNEKKTVIWRDHSYTMHPKAMLHVPDTVEDLVWIKDATFYDVVGSETAGQRLVIKLQNEGHWGKPFEDNIQIIRNYFRKGEVPANIAASINAPGDWVVPTTLDEIEDK